MLKGASGTLGESLIRSNMLSTDQLVSALRWQQNSGGSLDDALVELGFVSRDNLTIVDKGSAKGGAAIDLAQHRAQIAPERPGKGSLVEIRPRRLCQGVRGSQHTC